MRAKYAWPVVLVAALCFAAPNIALAKSKVSFSSIKRVYSIANGHNLTIRGHMGTKRGNPDWSMHAPVVVQWRVRGSWRDVRVSRLSSRGNYRFTLVKPHAGDYRVLYPGCSHYLSNNVRFDVRRGTRRTTLGHPAKLPPLLSVRNLSSVFFVSGESSRSSRSVTSLGRWPITFSVNTSQSPEAMTGYRLSYRVSASITGATYTPVYTFPSAVTFGGKQSISLVAVVPPYNYSADEYYNFYKVHVTWSGNRFTNSGSADAITEEPR